MKKRIFSLLIIRLLLVCVTITAFAHEAPDLNKKGSLEITMMMGSKIVSGGKLTCTQVGYIDVDDGNYFYRRLDGERIFDVFSEDAAKEMEKFLKEYRKTHSVSSVENKIGKDGKVKFEQLQPALYMISQDSPPNGYYAISPFLIAVPNNESGHYVYDISITSKTELKKKPTLRNPSNPSKTPNPTYTIIPPKPTVSPGPNSTANPINPTESPNPTNPVESFEPFFSPEPSEPAESPVISEVPKVDEPKLPQTGQLTRPIPIMITIGLILLAWGFVLRKGKNRDEE